MEEVRTLPSTKTRPHGRMLERDARKWSSPPVSLGEDATFRRWFWFVRGRVRLRRGSHAVLCWRDWRDARDRSCPTEHRGNAAKAPPVVGRSPFDPALHHRAQHAATAMPVAHHAYFLDVRSGPQRGKACWAMTIVSPRADASARDHGVDLIGGLGCDESPGRVDTIEVPGEEPSGTRNISVGDATGTRMGAPTRHQGTKNFPAGAPVWQRRGVMRADVSAPALSASDQQPSLVQPSLVPSRRSALWIGISRLRHWLPGKVRFLRWRSTRFLRHMLQKGLPMMAFLFLVGACESANERGERVQPSKSPKKEGSKLLLPPVPDLSKKERRPSGAPPEKPWTYVLPVDHGLRHDASGQGHFRAPRVHGEHNGIDLLAPIGTPVFSPCDGKVMAGASESFGRWLHVICPVPDAYVSSRGPHPWASFFYAHLSRTKHPPFEWKETERGEELGAVGKSGNARGPNVQPHLHFELIIQKNRRHAMDEHHIGSDQSSVEAANYFERSLMRLCLDPLGFRPKSRQLRRARRLDPFVVLTCLSDEKPDFRAAPEVLRDASHPWDRFYVAKNFNVNRGPEDRR